MNCTNCGSPVEITKENLPANLRVLSPWAYFGYTLLFSIPVVGFILLIVFSFNRGNFNRRSFARSYFCGLIIFAVIIAVFIVIAMATGLGAQIVSMFG